jgi:hypothetical protein
MDYEYIYNVFTKCFFVSHQLRNISVGLNERHITDKVLQISIINNNGPQYC